VPADKLQVQADKPEKYLYLAIVAYWITGILVVGCVFIYYGEPINADIPPALLASYLIGIAFIVFQSYSRNVGLSLLFSIMVPCVPLAVGVSWLFPLMASGFTVVAWLRRRDIGELIGRVGPADIAPLIGASGAFAAITLTSLHDAGFFFLRDIIHSNSSNPDPLFHSAIAAMIKNYGVSSVGLDGLVTLNYHVFSHILVAAMSFGTGLPVVTSYGALRLIMWEPLLLLTIVAAAETIRPSVNARGFFSRIVVLFIAFHAVRFWPIFRQFALWDSYATSYSYTISLILMMATICTMQMERGGYRLITLVALALLTTISKVSTGTICVAIVATHLALFDPGARGKRIIAGIGMMVGWGVLLYIEALQPRIPWLLSLFDIGTILKDGLIIVVAAVVAAGVFLLLLRRKELRKYALLACVLCVISTAAYLWLHPQFLVVSGIERFYFLRTYAGLPNDSGKAEFWAVLGKFTLVHFSFTWLLVVLAVNWYLFDRDKAITLGAPLLYSLLALGISWLVLFFTKFAGGAEYYFSNVAMFVALPYLLTILGEPISHRSLAPSVVASVVPLVLLAGVPFGAFADSYEKALTNFKSKAQDQVRNHRGPFDQKFAQIVVYLEEIRKDPSTKNLGVYIAKEERAFWNAKLDGCKTLPFTIPAVSERPGLLALPDPLVCPVNYYGFDQYRHEKFEMSGLARVSHEVLLKMAVEAGLDGYVDVRTGGWTVYKRDPQNGAVATPPKADPVLYVTSRFTYFMKLIFCPFISSSFGTGC